MNVTPLMRRSIYSVSQRKMTNWNCALGDIWSIHKNMHALWGKFYYLSRLYGECGQLHLLGEPPWEGQGECSGIKSKIKHLEKQIPPSAAQRTINPSGALLQMIIPMPSSHPLVAKLPLKPCSPDIVLAQNVSNFAEITTTAILP